MLMALPVPGKGTGVMPGFTPGCREGWGHLPEQRDSEQQAILRVLPAKWEWKVGLGRVLGRHLEYSGIRDEKKNSVKFRVKKTLWVSFLDPFLEMVSVLCARGRHQWGQ